MQLSDLIVEVKDRLGVPAAGDPMATDARITRAINAALRKVTMDHTWFWNLYKQVGFTFNNGSGALPADFVSFFGLSVQGYPIEQISKTDFLGQAVVATPDPFGVTILASTIELAPAPGGIINDTILLYYRSEPSLVAAADTPRLPAAHHDMLADYATGQMYLMRQDAARAAPWLASYAAWVKSMADETTPTKKHRIRDARNTAPLTMGASGFTFLSAPGPYAGGLILCTSLTRPTGVDGQWIFETDTRKVLEYDAAAVQWRVPWQIEWPDVYAMSDVIAL